ncbi:hypothetical protein F4703DRAFT_1305248 [Phycomyces blakesleeanus]
MNKYPGSPKGSSTGGPRNSNPRNRILANKVAAPRPINLPSLRRENAGSETPPPPPTVINTGWGSPSSVQSPQPQSAESQQQQTESEPEHGNEPEHGHEYEPEHEREHRREPGFEPESRAELADPPKTDIEKGNKNKGCQNFLRLYFTFIYIMVILLRSNYLID